MNRSYSSKAIIFSLKPQGENNSLVTLLTPDKGLIYATLYGGPKSRLKSLVSQFNSGNIWLYDTPEKKQTKITDFEVTNYHTSFSQNLFKLYSASLACELAIKTHSGGSNESFFTLISGFFDGMELCNEEQSRLGLIRFLWRFIKLLGIQPDSSFCAYCGTSILDTAFENDMQSYYNRVENIFACPRCLSHINKAAQEKNTGLIGVKVSALRYLTGISVLTPQEARSLVIDKEDYNELREIIFFLLENALGTKLNSLETGMGIL